MKIGNLDGVVDLRLALPQPRPYPWRPLSWVRYLVVHHSGVGVDSSAEAIAAYHTRVMGWPGIGYHFLVHQGGVMEYVGDVMQLRYNVAGRNHEVIGVCLPGDFSSHPPGALQLDSARLLLANIQHALGWFVPIVGHRDIALPGFGTACPGDTWGEWNEEVRVKVL